MIILYRLHSTTDQHPWLSQKIGDRIPTVCAIHYTEVIGTTSVCAVHYTELTGTTLVCVILCTDTTYVYNKGSLPHRAIIC